MKALAAILFLLPEIADAACRHALALGLDVSGSVDGTEYRLQLDGLASALESEAVQTVLFSPGSAPVRIAVYEWSGPRDQFTIMPWTDISDPSALSFLTETLRSATRHPADVTTAIGSAMTYGLELLRGQGDCWKSTLDLSGDGEANTGIRPQDVPRDQSTINVIVNGLTVAGHPASQDLQDYYSAYVIRGPGAFVEPADGFADYASAMERKLLRELQSVAIGVVQ